MANSKRKYSIGELSKICGISAKTLRFYDTKGLLKPSERDNNNNYRYYSEDQVLEALMIREMKRRGFTVTELSDFLKKCDVKLLLKKLEDKIGLLEKDVAQLNEQIAYTRNIHHLVSHALSVYTELQGSPDNFKISMMPKKTVLFTRYVSRVIATDIFWNRINEIQLMREKGKLVADGSFTAVFHDHYFNQFFFENGDLEVFQPIREGDLNDPHIKQFGGFLIASTIHVGKYVDLLKTYVELVKMIEHHHYKIVGQPIEEYLVEFTYGFNEEEAVTRLSFPVEPL